MAQSVQVKKENELSITPENQLQIVKQWGDAFNNLVATQNVQLTQNEREFGMSIITNLTNRCIQSGIKANELNMTDFLEQVKHCSKLQLSINEQELYLDIRNNKDTGLKTVKISRQYQGIQKLMTRYCSKKIVRFKDGIVCSGDIFEIEDDFDSGLTVIKKHIKNNDIDRNNFANIEKAYAIAYIEEYGKLVPYTVIIDKNRILRARNAATTDKVWQSDVLPMVRKTSYWSLWAFIKPYIELPIGLQESFIATEDEMDWDTTNKVDKSKTYDIDNCDNEVVIDDSSSFDGVKQNESDFVEISSQPETKEIWYSEYKENKEKYLAVERPDGSPAYNEATKKILVTMK